MITKYSYGQTKITGKENVIDYYKGQLAEEVRADLQPHRTDVVMILQHVDYNINIGSVIRSNNAFLGKEVYIVGRRRIDTRGCAGTNHYENVYHADNIKEVIDFVHSLGYVVYAIDNLMDYGPVNLMDVTFPERSAFIFGEEGPGLSKEAIDLSDGMIYIGTYGSVRSLNVAVAAGIVQYEYTRQWRLNV